MSTQEERLKRYDQIEEALIQASGEIGSIHELNSLVESAYGLLGAAFFHGCGIDEHQPPEYGDLGRRPAAELVMGVHELIAWSVLEMTADRRLRVLKKEKR